MEKLLILPFDHRSSFVEKILGIKKEVDEQTFDQVKQLKQLIFEGFLQVWQNSPAKDNLAILVDDEYGLDVITEAKNKGIKFALAVEKSGEEEFSFEHGDDFGEQIKNLQPDFVKALVRYNPEHIEKNKRQLEKLRILSNWCKDNNFPLIFELLVPATEADLRTYPDYDSHGRDIKTIQAIKEISKEVQVSVWKLEGFSREQWKPILETINPESQVILLGRGENEHKIEKWLEAAAPYERVIGFAIGRTIFAEAIKDHFDGLITYGHAVEEIAENYKKFIRTWNIYKNIS